MIKHLIYPIAIFVITIALLLLFYFGYLLLQPFTPPTVTPYPIPITNKDKVVHYGEPIQTKVVSCVFYAVPVTASVRYQDAAGRFYLFASHDSVNKKGCTESVQNRDPVPTSLPPGKYIIYVTAVFHVNPLKEVTKVYETEEFTVEK